MTNDPSSPLAKATDLHLYLEAGVEKAVAATKSYSAQLLLSYIFVSIWANEKIDLSKFTAIILTSRNAVDHFFRVAEEMRYKVPEDLKYFCQSEAIAFYLQKYVVYRKRKIYVGQKDFADLSPLIKKYKEEKFLLPASDQLNYDVPQTLNNLKVDWTPGTFYRTVMSDLSDLKDVYYDVLAFFSPTGIKSLFKNFPDFQQNETRIAVFGSTTQKEAIDHGLRVDIMAPSPEAPSMTMALEKYIAKTNKDK